ncbi:Holliday junction resolvase RuvX [Oceanithermus sp.]
MKVLGLDVGEARIGVAAAEEGRPLAFGRGWIERRGLEDDVARVRELARREGAGRVVVGLPRRTGGEEGVEARKVRAFARALEAAGLEVRFVDERFTTRVAAQALAHLPRKKRQQKGRLDEAAAVAILETYLERNA